MLHKMVVKKSIQLGISRHFTTLQTATLNHMIKNAVEMGNLNQALQHFDQNPTSRNVVSCNIVIDGYMKCGLIHNARQVFDEMPERDVVSWNIVISGYIKSSLIHIARQLFNEMPERTVVSWNIMIDGYVKSGLIDLARQLFNDMPERERDIVSWNTVLLGLRKIQDCHGAYRSYLELQRSGLRPNQYTFSTVLSSFSGTSFSVLVPQLHSQIVCLGCGSSDFVGSALLRGYTDLGDHSALCCAFDEVLYKGTGLWNTLIFGHMELGFIHEAQRAFDMIPEKNVVSWTTLVDGYLKNKQVKRAWYIFDKIIEKNVIAWTAMISGHVRLGKYMNALELFVKMMRSGTRANQHTFSSVLAACAGHSELLLGEQVHASIVKHAIADDVVLSTALVDMYAKCGDIEAALCIFETLPNKNVGSWNTMIGGFTRHGLSNRALNAFERMISSGLRPDNVTFVNVLSACGHGGLVVEGERIFNCMDETYGVSPEKEHYACMVDLYGKAGLLEKAKTLIECMPFKPDVVVWGALLGACGLHTDSEFSRTAAEAVFNLQKSNPVVYSILSKIHGEKKVWSSLTFLKTMMIVNGIKKQNAGSWIG